MHNPHMADGMSGGLNSNWLVHITRYEPFYVYLGSITHSRVRLNRDMPEVSAAVTPKVHPLVLSYDNARYYHP